MTRTMIAHIGLACILATSLSCNFIADKVDEIGQEPWPETVQLQVTGTRQVFDKNWEVKFNIQNDSDEPYALENLTNKQAKLVMSDGSRRPLHPISFGLKKPLTLAPHEHKSSAFLFRASDAKPEALLLRGKRFAVQLPE